MNSAASLPGQIVSAVLGFGSDLLKPLLPGPSRALPATVQSTLAEPTLYERVFNAGIVPQVYAVNQSNPGATPPAPAPVNASADSPLAFVSDVPSFLSFGRQNPFNEYKTADLSAYAIGSVEDPSIVANVTGPTVNAGSGSGPTGAPVASNGVPVWVWLVAGVLVLLALRNK